MQAYYETEIEIHANHQIHLHLPNEIPIGKAKVAVIYEMAKIPTKKTLMADFINSLPNYVENGLDKEAIQTFIRQERENWFD